MPYPWEMIKKQKLFGHKWIVCKPVTIYGEKKESAIPRPNRHAYDGFVYLTNGLTDKPREFDLETQAFKTVEDLNKGEGII